MKTIRATDLKQMLEEDPDAIVINVVTSDPSRSLRIPESHNVPANRDDFVEAVDELAGYRDRRVIVHCTDREGEAAPEAARRLEDAGFTDVIEFRGGLAEWKIAGYRLERSQTVTTL